MFDITLDLRPILQGLPLYSMEFEPIAQKTVEAVSYAIYDQIKKLAQQNLRSTRNRYVSSLMQPEFGRLEGTIILTGVLPNMIEQGHPAFDMKEGFGKSGKIKQGKNGGWYITIPFRHATAGSVGENDAFSDIMPREINELAKELLPTIKTEGDKTITKGSALKSTQLGEYGVLGERPAFSSNETKVTYGAYQHKAPIFSGMQRIVKDYQSASQGTYLTFRRVSMNSDPNAFIHPGIDARHFFDKASGDDSLISDTIGNTVDAYLSGMGV